MASIAQKTSSAALIALVACAGCKLLKKDTGDGGAADAAAGPVTARCFDLPGARRRALFASEDGKSLYYTEDVKGSAKKRVDLVEIRLDTGSPKVVVSDVGSKVLPAGKGRWVFARTDDERDVLTEYKLHVFDPTAGDKVIGPAKVRTDRFVVDPVTDAVYIGGGLEAVRKIPLAGGEGTESKTHLGVLWGIDPATKSIVARRAYVGGTCRQPLDNLEADCAPAGPDGYNLSLVQGGAVFYPKDDKETDPAPIGSKLDAAREPLLLAWAQKGDKLLDGGSPGAFVYVARSSEKETLLLRADVEKGDTVFRSNAVRLLAAVPAGADQVAVLLQQDDPTGEVDVCVVPAGAAEVTFATRSVSKELLPALAKVKPLLEGDLGGAKIDGVPGKYLALKITSEGSGPAEVDALRARVKDLQTKITQATGVPTLGVRLLYQGNGKEAVSEWREGGNQFFVGAGDKGKLLFDRSQFEVELDPSTLFKYRNESGSGGKFGSYTCRGTAKNIGQRPLAITVSCSVEARFLGAQKNNAAVRPSPLPPRGVGKFDFYAGSGQENATVEMTVLVDDKPVPFFNAFAERKALGKEP